MPTPPRSRKARARAGEKFPPKRRPKGEAGWGVKPLPTYRGNDAPIGNDHYRATAHQDTVARVMRTARTLRHAAKMAVAYFGVPRRSAAFILRMNVPAGIKKAKLVNECRKFQRFWSDKTLRRTARTGCPTFNGLPKEKGDTEGASET